MYVGPLCLCAFFFDQDDTSSAVRPGLEMLALRKSKTLRLCSRYMSAAAVKQSLHRQKRGCAIGMGAGPLP
jgi:hypothetical protein